MTAASINRRLVHLMALTLLPCAVAPSAVAASAATLAPPTNLLAKGGNESVALSWTASADAKTYDVYAAATRGGEGAHPVEVGITGTKAKVQNLVGGRKYYFEVRAARGQLLSAPSNEVSATPGGSLGVAYVLNDTGNQIAQFSIQEDGTLAALGTPTVGNLQRPQWMAMTPSGAYSYVINGNYVENQFALSQFRVGLDGSLSPLSAPYLYLGMTAPQQLVVSHDGHHAYLVAYANGSGEILQYDIGSDGALTASSNPPVATAASLGSMIAGRSALYTPNFNGNSMLQYAIGSGGALSPLDGGSLAAGINPIAVTTDPGGTHLYVTNFAYDYQGTVSQYNINRDGSLSPMLTPSVTVGYSPEQMVISPSGQFAYVANFCYGPGECGGNGSISIFSFDAGGSLTPVSTLNNVAYLRFMAIDPTSQYLYAVDGNGNVDLYDINNDGTLIATGKSVYVGDPLRIVIPGGSVN